MSELELYKRMFAKVVGEVDDVLQSLPELLIEGDCGREVVLELGERLKQALLDAEEMYMDAEIGGGQSLLCPFCELFVKGGNFS